MQGCPVPSGPLLSRTWETNSLGRNFTLISRFNKHSPGQSGESSWRLGLHSASTSHLNFGAFSWRRTSEPPRGLGPQGESGSLKSRDGAGRPRKRGFALGDPAGKRHAFSALTPSPSLGHPTCSLPPLRVNTPV